MKIDGAKMRELRLGLGYTLKQAAELIGCLSPEGASAMLSKIERGRRKTAEKSLISRLCKLYGVKLADVELNP